MAGVGLCVGKWLGACPVAGSALAVAASDACPGHRALAPGRIGRLPRPWGACPRPHRALVQATPGLTPGIYLRCVDWAHSQSLWPGALPGLTGRTPGIYASYATGRTPSPTLLGFQLYAISGWAHFRHRPTRHSPRLVALPGLRWQLERLQCQCQLASVYAICQAGLAPWLLLVSSRSL